jgi:hypothetical protein
MADCEAHRSLVNDCSGRRQAATMAQGVGGEYVEAYWQPKWMMGGSIWPATDIDCGCSYSLMDVRRWAIAGCG